MNYYCSVFFFNSSVFISQYNILENILPLNKWIEKFLQKVYYTSIINTSNKFIQIFIAAFSMWQSLLWRRGYQVIISTPVMVISIKLLKKDKWKEERLVSCKSATPATTHHSSFFFFYLSVCIVFVFLFTFFSLTRIHTVFYHSQSSLVVTLCIVAIFIAFELWYETSDIFSKPVSVVLFHCVFTFFLCHVLLVIRYYLYILLYTSISY